MSLTTVSWIALTTESYQGRLLLHTQLGVVLQTKAMPERHTAENQANMLSTATEHWGLNGKVTTCIPDNTSNMVLASTECLDELNDS